MKIPKSRHTKKCQPMPLQAALFTPHDAAMYVFHRWGQLKINRRTTVKTRRPPRPRTNDTRAGDLTGWQAQWDVHVQMSGYRLTRAVSQWQATSHSDGHSENFREREASHKHTEIFTIARREKVVLGVVCVGDRFANGRRVVAEENSVSWVPVKCTSEDELNSLNAV